MKTTFIALCLCVPLMGADKKPLTKEESAKVIEAAIRKYGENTPVIHLWDKQLTDLKGVEELTGLTRLWLQNNHLTDVKIIKKFKNLTHLSVQGNRLTSVKDLENLAKLEYLYLDRNRINDVDDLGNSQSLNI